MSLRFKIALLRQYTDIPVDDDDQDTMLRELEANAIELLEQETGRHLGEEVAIAEVLDGSGSDELRLSNDPAAITSIEVRSSLTWTAVPATQYMLDGRRVIHVSSLWDKGVGNFRVTYTFGYEADGSDMPGHLRQAVLELIGFMYKNRVGSTRLTTDIELEELPGIVKRVIDREKNPDRRRNTSEIIRS